jgi:hypothetical protein
MKYFVMYAIAKVALVVIIVLIGFLCPCINCSIVGLTM